MIVCARRCSRSLDWTRGRRLVCLLSIRKNRTSRRCNPLPAGSTLRHYCCQKTSDRRKLFDCPRFFIRTPPSKQSVNIQSQSLGRLSLWFLPPSLHPNIPCTKRKLQDSSPSITHSVTQSEVTFLLFFIPLKKKLILALSSSSSLKPLATHRR